MQCILMIVGLSLASGCASNPDWCLTNEPYRPGSVAELNALSDENVEQLLTKNQFGAKNCGWSK